MSAIIPKISRLSERVVRILGCNPGAMTLQGTNTYLIGTGEKRILLDAGEPNNKEYLDSLRSFLEKEKVQLSHIVITHHHLDHLGGVRSLLDHLNLEGRCHVFKYFREQDSNVTDVLLEPLKDGDEFHTEGATIKFYHTPGHTEDHLAALLLEENALFSGDCVLGEGTAVFENLRQLMHSLAFFLDLQPDIIYPGHGPIVKNPVEKIQEYITHRLQREQQILSVIPQNPDDAVSIPDIVRLIYTNLSDKLIRAAAINVYHHLTKLEEENRVRCLEVDGDKKFVRV